MKIDGRLFIVVIMALALIPGVHGVTSLSDGVKASVVDGSASGLLSANPAGYSSGGSCDGGDCDLSFKSGVSNTGGSSVGIGLDILNADLYIFSYTISPGLGDGWKASKYPEVSATESLDVQNANYIKASALARNSKSNMASSTETSDPSKHASLLGYRNAAVANKNKVEITQSANSVIGPASTNILGTDGRGKEARSQANFVGVYSLDQSALIDGSNARADLGLKGVGYLFDGSTTSAKNGNGNEAVTKAGSWSGDVIKNTQSSLAGTSLQASQDLEAEYQPVSYWTGTYDQTIAGTFSSSVKQNDGRVAVAQVDVNEGEHFADIQSASIDKTTGKASNFADTIIGVAIPSVSVKDKTGKGANSLASFTGVYSLVQSASLDKSTVQSSLDMNGVGYFAGATTFATDGKHKEAVAKQEGAISGYMGLNKQNALIGSKAEATQKAMFGYAPTSYRTGSYYISWMTFSTQAKAKNVNFDPVTIDEWAVYIPYEISQAFTASDLLDQKSKKKI